MDMHILFPQMFQFYVSHLVTKSLKIYRCLPMFLVSILWQPSLPVVLNLAFDSFPFVFIFRTFCGIQFSQICIYESAESYHAIYIHYISHTEKHMNKYTIYTRMHPHKRTNKQNKRERLQSTLRAAHQIIHQNIRGVPLCQR